VQLLEPTAMAVQLLEPTASLYHCRLSESLAKNPAKPKKVELWIPAEIGQLITGIILSDGTIVFPNGTPEGMLGYKLGKRIENQN